MACLRLLRGPISGRSLLLRTSPFQCRFKTSSYSSNLSAHFFDQPEKLQRLKEVVKTTLPYLVDDIYVKRSAQAESSTDWSADVDHGEQDVDDLLRHRSVTRRHEMTELLGECFGSKVKDVTTAVLHSCFFGAAVLPAHISMDLNELWVVYTMKDNDFFEKHLWQADRAHRSEALVYDGWLHVIETQDFLRMVFDGESKYAELILSPHINRVVATKDWMSFQSHVQKGSTRLASGRYVAKALVAITKLREEIRQEQKSEVQGVRPSFDAVIRWATIFRLLYNLDCGLSGRQLVGYKDIRTHGDDASDQEPFLNQRAEVWALQAYRDGIMFDSDLDKHLFRILSLHTSGLGATPVAIDPGILLNTYSYMLLARAEGWMWKDEKLSSPPVSLKEAVAKQMEKYYSLLTEEAESKAKAELSSAEKALDQAGAAVDKKHADELEVIKARIALMEEVWGDERTIALDQVLDEQEDAKFREISPKEGALEIITQDLERDVHVVESTRNRLRDLVNDMHVMAMAKWKEDTSFILYCYPVAQQIVEVSTLSCKDDSDVFSGVEVLSDVSAGRRVLACNISWFLRHLPYEPAFVDVFLSEKEYLGQEVNDLAGSIESRLLGVLCKNLCAAAREAAADSDVSAASLQKIISKMRQAQDLLAGRHVEYPPTAYSLPESVDELKSLCSQELQRLEASASRQLGEVGHDLSAISDWLRKTFHLAPVKHEEVDIGNVSRVDQWIIQGIPKDVRNILKSIKPNQHTSFLAPDVKAEPFHASAAAIFGDVVQLHTEAVLQKLRIPPPPLPPRKPDFNYLEWRLVRKRRRQEDVLSIRIKHRGKVGRFGRKVMPRSGWFVGQRRKPVDFSETYNYKEYDTTAGVSKAEK